MTKVVLTRPFVSEAGRPMLEACCKLIVLPRYDADELSAQIQDCDAILAFPPDRIDAELLAAGPRLRLVASAGAGVDHIDVSAATARRIMVTNVSGVGARSIAEHALALMLALAKRLLWLDARTRAGDFNVRWDGKNHEITGKTLAIIGYGAIGRDLAVICHGAFEMPVLSVNSAGAHAAVVPPATPVTVDEAFRRADIVSIHLPLTDATRGLIGRRLLALMQPHAWLINTGRGGVVDEDALVDALRSNAIAGAAVDVFDKEPPPPDYPLMLLANAIVTPHLAGITVQSLARLSIAASQNIVDGLSGRRPNGLVNTETWPSAD